MPGPSSRTDLERASAGTSAAPARGAVDRPRRRLTARIGVGVAAAVLGSGLAVAVGACGEDREGTVENIGGETGATTGAGTGATTGTTVETGEATAPGTGPTGTTTDPSGTTTPPSGDSAPEGE